MLSSKLEEAEGGMGDLCLGISTGGVGACVKRDVQARYVWLASGRWLNGSVQPERRECSDTLREA